MKEWRLGEILGHSRTGPGQFNLPHAIAIESNDKIYVGDRSNRRIQVFDIPKATLSECSRSMYLRRRASPLLMAKRPRVLVWLR